MIFSKTRPLFFFGAVLLLAFVMAPVSVEAQKRLKYSTTEDIAIAFYKTGGVVPNFDRWIKQREPYTITPWARMDEVYQAEMSRLQLAYKNYKPKDDYLMIRTFVRLDTAKETTEDGENIYKLNTVFLRAPDALYFPYDFLDERIVVMPDKLDVHMNSTITKEQYDYISEAIPHSAKNTMVVRLLAKDSNTKKPYQIDGMQQWVMTADIASLEVWSRQGRLLWEYTAPWYVSPHTKKLNNLFDDGPVMNPDAGEIKPLKPLDFVN